MELDRAQNWNVQQVRVGTWVFLASEVMLFGGFFVAYVVLRSHWNHAFHEASSNLNVTLGTINTVVLLISSYYVALAEESGEKNDRRRTFRALTLAACLGTVFLAIKGYEYFEKFHHHHIPGSGFAVGEFPQPGPAQLFYYLYFAGTGLHFLHLSIGIIWIAAWVISQRRRTDGMVDHGSLGFTALYWHFVDVVWIFLFPFFYLI